MRVKTALYKSLNVLMALAMMLVTVPMGGAVAEPPSLDVQLASAVDYAYESFEWVGDVDFDDDSHTFTGRYLEEQFIYDSLMNDLARYLGALYRQDGSTIVLIEYDETKYTWNEAEPVKGSNWEDDQGTTLVSVMVADYLEESEPIIITVSDGVDTAEINFVFLINYPMRSAVRQDLIELEGVTIAGTARVGETLEAVVLPDGATADYQWQISDNPGGPFDNIGGATGDTYVIPAGDVGNYLIVSATGTGDYEGEVTSEPTSAVDPKTIDIAVIPGVTPPTTGGTPVTVITPTDQYTGTVSWSPNHNPFQADVIYTATITLTPATGYTLSGVSANFFTVAGATASNTANSGVVSAEFPSTSVITLDSVTIDGIARVGETLQAVVSPQGATADYQWKISTTAGGTYTDIPGATSSTYAIPAGDVGKYLKVSATGTDNYSGVVTSDATSAVAAKTIDIPAIPGVTAPATGGTPVTVITPTDQYTGTVSWSPSHATFVSGAAYTATITLRERGGYTFQGVPSNFFTVAGAASVSNIANSGVVNVIYPLIPTANNDTYKLGLANKINLPAPGVLANDIGETGAALTARIFSNPSVGVLQMHPGGGFEYTRPEVWPGKVTFTYRACDGDVCSAPATVTIEESTSCLVVTSDPLEKRLQPDTTGQLDLIMSNTCSIPIDFDLKSSISVTEPFILSEDFDRGVWPPNGWEIGKFSSLPWEITSIPGEVDGGTGYAAYVRWHQTMERDEWLITPELDVSSFTDLMLSFRAFSRTRYPDATMQVWVLDDNNNKLTENPLWDMVRDEVWDTQIYRTVLVDLSQFAGKDAIHIAWRYVGKNGESFGLDTIKVGSPSDVPWLSLSINRESTSWAIPPRGNVVITLDFDATGLDFMNYEALLFIRNAPYPVINLPVHLNVRAEEDFLYYLPLITK